MTSAHHFIDISQNILNLWMRLIFLETRHLGLQFEHKNEAIPIRIESDMIFWSWLYMLLQQLRENRTLLAPHSHQYSHLMHQISPKAKIRSRFMILCQPSLNGFPFIFPPPLLYIPPSHSFQDTKTPSLLLSWVLGSWGVLSYLGLPDTQGIEWDSLSLSYLFFSSTLRTSIKSLLLHHMDLTWRYNLFP